MQCAALKSVQLSEGMSEIPYGMFAYCAALQAIEIPTSIKAIGEAAFSGCKALEEISFPEGTEEIGGSSFTGCQNLFKVSFSSTVRKIGSQAFNYCDALINVFNYAQIPQNIGDDVFSVYRKLHVVEGREEAYKAAPGWRKFTITGDIAGINDVYGDITQPVESYDFNGRRVDSDYRGIRIDVYPDGRRIKTVVR